MGDNRLQVAKLLLDVPWPEIIAATWKYSKKLFRGLSHEGMYEVLAYESTLELFDSLGKTSSFIKRKKVRYLQDNIIAYQDYAWGDGQILQNYQCAPGEPVDQYRSGYKTYVLISLREVKSRGDIDEFNIHWDHINGYLKPDGFWDTDITQRTKRIKVHVIFPPDRHPQRVTMHETNHYRTHILGREEKSPGSLNAIASSSHD